VVAGCFTFASPEGELLVKHLPPIIHLPAAGPHSTSWFQSTLQFIAAETAQDLPGSAAIVDRLAEVLFVQAMRSRTQPSHLTGNPSWLGALGDRQIGEALRLMHAEPGRGWTVPELARSVSMSRSAFRRPLSCARGRDAARSLDAVTDGAGREDDSGEATDEARGDRLGRRV
jgi:hypothetical protein